ncbi:MAG: hypothetical protein IJZ45_11380 [Bacteroidaceae bacterium]|nr:hypothetical protein [Bacteroidaceae bacterium]
MYEHTLKFCKHAAAFFEVGRIAISNARFERGNKEPTIEGVNMLLVGCTNLAFANELAIKAFLREDYPHIHDLNELFNKLEDDEKHMIVDSVIYDFKHRKDLEKTEAANLEYDFEHLPPERQTQIGRALVEKKLISANNPPICDSEAEFYQLLEQCKQNYNQTRFIYEGKVGSFHMPFTFMDSLARQLLFMAGLDYNVFGEDFYFRLK